MKLEILFFNIDKSESVKNKIEEKLNRFQKHFDQEIKITWHCSKEKADLFKSLVNMKYQNQNFIAQDSKNTLYKTIDGIINKLEQQFKSIKNKHNHKFKNKITNIQSSNEHENMI